MSTEIRIQVLSEGEGLPLPEAATPGSSGVDLLAAVHEPVILGPGHRALIPSGLAVSIPEGWEWQIRPRSGIALRHGVTVLNAPGTVDSDYRGPVKVLLINHGSEPYTVRRGDRIAQAVLARVEDAVLRPVPELPVTSRGEGGFGHTGA